MIEVQIPKDVSVYESPLVGPLTARQTVCVAITAAVEYAYYMVIKNLGLNLSMDATICIGLIFAIPILYMAVGKPYGMKPETYIYYYLIPSLIAPKDRPYETKLSYDVMLEEIEARKEAEELKKSNGKNKPKNKTKTEKKKPRKVTSKQDIMYA